MDDDKEDEVAVFNVQKEEWTIKKTKVNRNCFYTNEIDRTVTKTAVLHVVLDMRTEVEKFEIYGGPESLVKLTMATSRALQTL